MQTLHLSLKKDTEVPKKLPSSEYSACHFQSFWEDVMQPNNTFHGSLSVLVAMWLLKRIQCPTLQFCNAREVEESS